MLGRSIIVLLALPNLLPAQLSMERILSRLTEEAEAVARIAPLTVSEETLVQRVSQAPSLVRRRAPVSPGAKPGAGFRTRAIISEYTLSTFSDAPNVLHEIRQVLSVDGTVVRRKQPGRITLSLGSTSRDDRVKRRLIREFEDLGLTSMAVDLGQIILLFTGRRVEDYEFSLNGFGTLPPEMTMILEFRQISGDNAVTIFEGRTARREPIQGELWVRESDGLPLRIVIHTNQTQGGHTVRSESTVDYGMSPHGALLPSAVTHREYLDGRLEAEISCRYAPFRRFSSESTIKFDEVKK